MKDKEMKIELKTKPIYEFRCDERLKTKVEESTLLVWTLLYAELEHLKIETRLIDEMFESDMGEYVFLKIGASSILRLTREPESLTRVQPTFERHYERNATRLKWKRSPLVDSGD